MRRYHRWLAPLFAVFFLWIAVTGITIQLIKLQMPARPGAEAEEARGPSLIPAAQAHEPGEHAAAPAAAPAAAEASAPAPQSAVDRRRAELHDLSEYVMDLHSGKILGPVGTWLSIASGLVLIFLAASGLTMYIQMFRARARRDRAGNRFFW